MYIAMNRFRVVPGYEEAFEAMWRGREGRLAEMPGYLEFHMLKGPKSEDHTLYASHTVWESFEHFQAWTKSEQFRAAHAKAGENRGKIEYLSGPHFEGFEVIIREDRKGVRNADAA
ncbi:antibiotic biosynthesis monooxygenase family protein [Pseudorhizobium pelagicum]|uniref:Antibiotic biosynthesis monooxygenase n=1 Tax=Pseudorhizobium pelagicum TaxID=1509405 RepID=A0A922NZN9_9HYPH|nr:antibiotic biosynthesis monooxygenase [Pseudorhizobium pelagicum]KEQ06511.1 antibiotic biosynthesis monooxygenase [Pseudorhizobium pelagicum]KEQ09667.1 antibiotic biosynthesis monooxygenase [Pseudorhizobium pelagicum]